MTRRQLFALLGAIFGATKGTKWSKGIYGWIREKRPRGLIWIDSFDRYPPLYQKQIDSVRFWVRDKRGQKHYSKVTIPHNEWFHRASWTNNPTTGKPWTSDDINNAQFGVE